MGGFNALWVRLRNRIDREVFDAAPRVRFVITNTTGLNHIDQEEADRRGVRVISLRGESEFLKDVRATAEHTVGLLLALMRRIPAARDHVRRGGWNRDLFRGNELYGKTAGIVGYGRLGRLVATIWRTSRCRSWPAARTWCKPTLNRESRSLSWACYYRIATLCRCTQT